MRPKIDTLQTGLPLLKEDSTIAERLRLPVSLLFTGVLMNSLCLSFFGVAVSVIMAEGVSSYQEDCSGDNATLLNSSNGTSPSSSHSDDYRVCDNLTAISGVWVALSVSIQGVFFLQCVVMKSRDAPRPQLFKAFLLLALLSTALELAAVAIWGRDFYFYYGVLPLGIVFLGFVTPVTVKHVYRKYRKKQKGSAKGKGGRTFYRKMKVEHAGATEQAEANDDDKNNVDNVNERIRKRDKVSG